MIKIFKIGSILGMAVCVFVGLVLPPLAAAQSIGAKITFENGHGPLFDFDGFLPGDSASSWVKAENLGTSDIDVTVWAVNAANADKLADAMQFTIKKDSDTLYQDTLANFFNSGHVFLSTLDARETATYDLTLEFDHQAGNEYQSKNVAFDLAVNASENGNGISIIGDDDDSGNGDTSDSDSSGPVMRHSSGMIVGASPSLLIDNVRAENITAGRADILWDTNLPATSQIIYSLYTLVSEFDPDAALPSGYNSVYPAAEGSDLSKSHIVSLSGLDDCAAYFYRVVSHNLSSLPSISQEYAFVTACSRTGTGGFDGGALSGNSSKNKEVLGLSEENTGQPASGIKEAADVLSEEEWPRPDFAALDAASGFTLNTCAPDMPWWLLLLFIAYPVFKGNSRFKEAKKTANPAAAKFSNASGRMWIYSSFVPALIAIWAYFNQRCLPWWPFFALLFFYLAVYVYDRRRAANVIKRSANG